jgi:competence protein ComEC
MRCWRFTPGTIVCLLFCIAWTIVGCEYAADHASDVRATATSARGSASTRANGLLQVFFFDVGQGDATLLAGPDFTVLVDAGRHDRNDVVAHLQAAGIEKIDLLIGTHPHADHIGQFPAVLRAFPVREVWMSGDQHTSRTFERAVDAILESGAGYHEPRAGEVLQLGSARIEVLNPSRLNGDFHAGCIALRVVYGDIAFMLMGDTEVPQEHQIIQSGFHVESQVLKLGHHGSSTSTSDAYVTAVRPSVAIYSAGAGNTYGHPHDLVLQRMQRFGIPVYGTDQHGTILISTDGKRFETQTSRRSGAHAFAIATTAAVNLNTASPQELLQITHMTPQRVDELIRLRPIRGWEQLTEISGIGPVRLSEIRQQGRARLE